VEVLNARTAGLARLAAVAGAVGLAAALAAMGASAAGSGANRQAAKPVIALSNSFIGNSWRKQMVKSFSDVAAQAKKQGLIGDFTVANANNTVEQQISQINGLILKHVDAIVIDAASPTALNGVIAKAVKAGITVVSFDGTVTSPVSYNLNYDFLGFGRHVGDYVANRIGGKGNVLIVRGVAGTIIDQQENQGWKQALAKHSGIKVVGTLFGNWDDATAQSAVARVLPSLPKVDAVVMNGGGYGVSQAFVAAKRPTPLIYLGNRGYELHWWAQLHKQNGYTTESASTTPSVSTAAFWIAVNVIKGAKFSHNLKMDFLTITEKDLPKYGSLPLDAVAATPYSNAWVLSHFKH
jgi:ribose transport system substrate-binding protein